MITPDHQVSFWNDHERTREEFQRISPHEGGRIDDFFHLLRDTAPASFGKLRNITFQALLDEYFQDHKLKAILSLPFLGIGGLPPSMISAFTAAKLYSEFLFDGGYYPTGGMQTLPDVLAARYKEFGGELLLSTPVKKIAVQDHAVRGVVLDGEVYLPARNVISNCDARKTFFHLLGEELVEREFKNKLSSMLPSLSNFIIYVGVDDQITHSYPPGVFLFFLGHYDLEKIYEAARNNEKETYDAYTVRIGHDGTTMNAIALASYATDEYWKHNKLSIQEALLSRLEAGSFSGLSTHIRFKDSATPQTLCRYTSNYQGASFGWAGIPSQFAVPLLRKPSFIQGLYLVGHWTTLGVGISGSAYVGQDTAKILLRKSKVWDRI
jgi:phytoene dehydrogenase-like protein